MSDHDHDHHGHDHDHGAPPNPYHRTDRDAERNRQLAEQVARLEAVLVEKGLVDRDALDRVVALYENDLGPMNGARVVARAWTHPDYRERLLDDATAAIGELGFGGLQGEHMVVVENTPEVHNLVVCTLC
ncbi:MAG TPA: nitrile hydratase subunit alpha, partial [Croceibacterium sp.]|nr:nitrile hydratase subunit alpha [Croceibacterium sp.]